MKQFIVLTAVLPILLLFLLQVGYDQRNINTVNQIQAVVYAAKEDAKLEGYFSEARKDLLKFELENIEGVVTASIHSPQHYPQARYGIGENRFIDYEVEVVLENVMAGGDFVIEPDKNTYTYVLKSYTASEYLE